MRLPPTVHVELGPSPLAGIATGLAAFAAFAVILAVPVDGAWQAVAGTLVLVWAAWTFGSVALRRGGRAVTALRLAPDRLLVVHTADGRLTAGHVRSATYVSAALTTLVWRPDGAAMSRTVLVLPDMLPAEDFRRLRVLLRYARSGVTQEAPASQP
jgi:hypothetical protein